MARSPVAIVEDFSNATLEATKDNIVRQYERLGLRASGFFASNIEIQGNKLFVPFYGLFIQDGVGAKPATMPPLNIIEQWVRRKGIKGRDKRTGRFQTARRTAFAIAKSISERGTEIYRGTSKGIDYDKALEESFDDNLDFFADDIADLFRD